MVRYVALLRGINVGGHNRVAMGDLRSLIEDLGFTDVRTYLNSGNVVFSSRERSNDELATTIADGIETSLKSTVPVIVRSGAELQAIIDRNPFPQHAADHKTLHVTFFGETPDQTLVDAMQDVERGDDDFRVLGDEIYLYYPNKITGAVFMPNGLDKALQVTTTSRNWRTVTKLAELANG